MHGLAAQYPEKVTLIPLGHTGEGREMYAMEIRTPSANENRTDGANFNFGGEQDLGKEKTTALRGESIHAEYAENEECSQGMHAENKKDKKSKKTKGKKSKKTKGKDGRRRKGKDKERVETGGKTGFIVTGAQHAREVRSVF